MSGAPAAAGPAIDRAAVDRYLRGLQQSIVRGLEAIDGGQFLQDAWERKPGADGGGFAGNGLTCVLEDGRVFERAGVLFSEVHLDRLPAAASANRPHLAGRAATATGVSLVIHPRNPYVPIVHLNVRFFLAPPTTDGEAVWWFGGGMDLTPCYGFEEDARHFHRTCRDALAPHGPDLYPRFKRWCDRYFHIEHRNEARGIGGVFFDDLNEPGFGAAFAVIRAVGDAFLPAYEPIVRRRMETPWGERERAFQGLRRGRYVEFNLVLDRGTQFGLRSGGRAESILCSMPPQANWRYRHEPEPGSVEARFAGEYLVPREWV